MLMTPSSIREALQRADIGAAEALLLEQSQAGVVITSNDTFNRQLLLRWACQYGLHTAVEQLLVLLGHEGRGKQQAASKTKEVVWEEPPTDMKDDRYALLHLAVLSGSVGVVEVLLRYGAPPDVRDGMDLTPLHYASLAGSLAMVQLLLDHGADPRVTARSSFSALHLAAQRGFTTVVRALLVSGSPVNTPNNIHFTALHFASQQGNLEMVQLLIGHGAEVRCRDMTNQTPLDKARLYRRTAVLAVLQQARQQVAEKVLLLRKLEWLCEATAMTGSDMARRRAQLGLPLPTVSWLAPLAAAGSDPAVEDVDEEGSGGLAHETVGARRCWRVRSQGGVLEEEEGGREVVMLSGVMQRLCCGLPNEVFGHVLSFV